MENSNVNFPSFPYNNEQITALSTDIGEGVQALRIVGDSGGLPVGLATADNQVTQIAAEQTIASAIVASPIPSMSILGNDLSDDSNFVVAKESSIQECRSILSSIETIGSKNCKFVMLKVATSSGGEYTIPAGYVVVGASVYQSAFNTGGNVTVSGATFNGGAYDATSKLTAYEKQFFAAAATGGFTFDLLQSTARIAQSFSAQTCYEIAPEERVFKFSVGVIAGFIYVYCIVPANI